jgi:hypothetical protein
LPVFGRPGRDRTGPARLWPAAPANRNMRGIGLNFVALEGLVTYVAGIPVMMMI